MEKEYKELIIGFLQNLLDEEETNRFFSWLNEDPGNKKLFFELKAIYESSDDTSMDIEKSWLKLLSKQKAASAVTGSGKSKKISIWQYATVAAVAILLTSSVFLYFSPTGQQQELKYITGNGLLVNTLELPDGSRVQLGHSSTLYYGSGYGKKNRTVYLEGEAFFEVAKRKDQPFVVKLDQQDITALGTKFNVMAYPADSIYATTLIEGSVKLNTKGVENILYPNQQLVYNKVSNAISMTNNMDANIVTSWIAGYYNFPGETLKSMLHRLGNIYGVKFVINSGSLGNRKFNGTFYSGQKITDILEIIQLSIPIKYIIEDDERIIINEN